MRVTRLAWTVVAVGLLVEVGCADTPDSAGNATVEFREALGAADYERLEEVVCNERDAALDEALESEFSTGELAEYATARSVTMLDPPQRDGETLDEDVMETSVPVEGLNGPDLRLLQTWVFDMAREGGDWCVRGLSLTDSHVMTEAERSERFDL